ISRDGRHLTDGLPFGRPLLRLQRRPEVRIPPRKRGRAEEEATEDVPPENAEALAWARITREGAEGDGDRHEGQARRTKRIGGPSRTRANVGSVRTTSPRTIAQITEAGEDDEDDDEEDEDDEDFEAGDRSDHSETSSEESFSDVKRRESDSGSKSSGISSASDSESNADESMGEASWNGMNSAPPTPANRRVSRKDPAATTASPVPSANASTSKRKAPSEDHEQDGTGHASKRVKQNASLPFQGKPETKARNARKRDVKKLAHLKRTGQLPENATLQTLFQWQDSQTHPKPRPAQTRAEASSSASDTSSDTSEEHVNGVVKQLRMQAEPSDSSDSSSDTSDSSDDGEKQVNGTAKKHTPAKTLSSLPPGGYRAASKPAVQVAQSTPAQIETERQQLLSAIQSGGVDVSREDQRRKKAKSDDGEAPEETGTKRSNADAAQAHEQAAQAEASDRVVAEAAARMRSAKATDMVPASVARRSKLDLAGSQRLLFGSLGVRVPRTQQEKDTLQQKLAEKAMQRGGPAAVKAVAEPLTTVDAETTADAAAAQIEGDDDESWREKIELTAIECCDEGVTLSTPPFPFYQRWDPQQRKKKAKARTGNGYAAPKNSRKKGGVVIGGHTENYDKYNTNGGGDSLDYDDAAGDDGDEYWEEGALLDGDVEQDEAAKQLQRETAEQEATADDFPPLPDDVNVLSTIKENDAQGGDYIAYTELSCSAATNWQPSMVTRSAQLVGKDEDGIWSIKLALRDVPAKQYDDDGNRVYKKFEMEGLSDDEEGGEKGRDERVRNVVWEELVEVRLLLRLAGTAASNGGVQTA
ncbi:hypothetical protein LTR53_016351, partial [Teratosphaeriaceae sp. CCFEE 6253]